MSMLGLILMLAAVAGMLAAYAWAEVIDRRYMQRLLDATRPKTPWQERRD